MTATDVQTVKVGTIFSSSWGYEQTNVDFYQVVRVSDSGKTVWLRHVPNKVVEQTGFMSETVVPDLDRLGEVNPDRLARRKVHYPSTSGGSTIGVMISSCEYASLWDGKPERASHYA